ncbi:hypothetical protein HWV62_25782 [Athelia sp. TMB]|nr:hypothetical protein HWV62_25782 [Athelia sp. TMB]
MSLDFQAGFRFHAQDLQARKGALQTFYTLSSAGVLTKVVDAMDKLNTVPIDSISSQLPSASIATTDSEARYLMRTGNEAVEIVDAPTTSVSSHSDLSKATDDMDTSENGPGSEVPQSSAASSLAAGRSPSINTSASTRMNVIVFGEAGVGKSSLVNMLAGGPVAATSSDAKGCTFKSTGYEVDVEDGPLVKLWDTAGLEETDTGKVDALRAISNIYALTRYLEDGVSLMVYCVRSRITKNTVKNYEMFRYFCNDQVPIALVVTGLEHETDKDEWWRRNVEEYWKAGLKIGGHACITTLNSPHWAEEYAISALKARALIGETYLSTPWKEERKTWIARSVGKFLSLMFGMPSESCQLLHEGLRKRGFTKAEAKAAVKIFKNSSI